MAKKPSSIQKRQIKKYIDELSLPENKANLRAVAIKYDVKKDRAPKILASGKGGMAEEILRLAEENEVPFYEDKTLVDLLSKLRFDEEIPPQLYTLVAEVLAFVYQLEKLAKKRQQVRLKFSKKK
jgi:flagellar biosynthesis protein